MAITASKPAINIREKLSELDQPQGIKGTEVLRADTADEARNAIGARGRKNLIINGGFDVWQRGVSQTSNGFGSDDRWRNLIAQTTQSVSRQAFTLGQTDVPNNPKYFSRTVVSSVAGANSYCVKTQPIEDVTRFSGKTVTLSFWAKADANKNIATEFYQNSGSGGSSADVPSIGVTTHNLTTTWQKFTVTVTTPSVTGMTLGSGSNDCFIPHFWFDAGSGHNARTNSLGQQSGTFDIANVQLELGNRATEFEHRSYGEELALCQRYYYRIDGTTYVWITPCQRHGSGMRSVISLPVALRSAPSIYYDNIGYWYNNGGLNNGAYNFSLHYISASATNITQLNLYFDPSYHYLGSNANLTAMLSIESGVSTGYLAFDAEL